MLESTIKLTIKILRYLDMGASTYCILLKPYRDSQSIIKIQQTDGNYCFSLLILAILDKVDTHRERVSLLKKHFIEFIT